MHVPAILCLLAFLAVPDAFGVGLVSLRKRRLASSVQELVSGLYYSNSGTVCRTDRFELLGIQSIYNEAYNYLDAPVDTAWHVGGHVRYLFQINATGSKVPEEFVNNTDFPGGDYKKVGLSSTLTTWQECRDLCALDSLRCTAWTFDSFYKATMGCYLKTTPTARASKAMVVSGCMNNSLSTVCVGNMTVSSPPSGMRSAVPLGSLGGGTIELRADGRLADWEIFNNGPQARGGGKINVNEAVVGIMTKAAQSATSDTGTHKGNANQSFASLLRTHMDSKNRDLPVVDSLTYNGAFPTARLTAEDDKLQQNVTVTAFSPFMRLNPNNSITPAIAFHVNITNQQSDAADVALFFNLPNMLTGMSSTLKTSFSSFKSEFNQGVTLSASGTSNIQDAALNGNLTICAMKKTDDVAVSQVTMKTSQSLAESWDAFVSGGGAFPNGEIDPKAAHAAIAANLVVSGNTSTQVTLILSWFLPHRYFADREIGQYYSNFYTSSENVADSVASGIIPILSSIKDWNDEAQFTHGQPEFKAAFPSDFLDDALVNSPGAMSKTAMFLADGRWRQYESHSCSQMEPPHIHGYRALTFHVLFPTLEHQTLMLYAEQMTDDGLVSEQFGGGCSGASARYNLDMAGSGARGDDNAVFIMDVYMNWLNYDEEQGKKFLDSISSKFRLAVEWQLAHATKYGITEDLVNTFDEHGQIGDVNSYNGFMYISSLSAAAFLANVTSAPNTSFVAEILSARKTGLQALNKLLWTGAFYRSFWCANGQTPQEALQSDSLYGVVWAQMFNFDTMLNTTNLVSHLHEERKRNLTPYGMQFCTGRGTYSYHCSSVSGSNDSSADHSKSPAGYQNPEDSLYNLGSGFGDEDTWEAHTLNSGTLSLFLRATSDEDALYLSALTIDKYRLTLRDQWDYRDLSSCYAGDVPGATTCSIRPVCNSHYSRQLIFWALLIALGGQRYDPRSGGLLQLSPRPIVSQQWPIILGMGSALMRPAGHKIKFSKVTNAADNETDQTGMESTEHIEGVAVEGECYEVEVLSGRLAVKHLQLFGVTLAMEVGLAHRDIATYCF